MPLLHTKHAFELSLGFVPGCFWSLLLRNVVSVVEVRHTAADGKQEAYVFASEMIPREKGYRAELRFGSKFSLLIGWKVNCVAASAYKSDPWTGVCLLVGHHDQRCIWYVMSKREDGGRRCKYSGRHTHHVVGRTGCTR